MKIQRQGVILKTVRQRACVEFYRTVLELDVLFENDFLTCFAWGQGYLMVEPATEGAEDPPSGNLVLRFHVESPRAEQARLEKHGLATHFARFEWGEILTFEDPAGTKIELKDAATFEQQIHPQP